VWLYANGCWIDAPRMFYCVIWERMNNEARSSGSRNIDAAKYSSLSEIDDLIQSRTLTITPIYIAFADFKASPTRYLGSTLLRHSSSEASVRALVRTARENQSQIHYGTEHYRRYELISPRSLTPSQQTRCDQVRFQLRLQANGHLRMSGSCKSRAEDPKEMGAW